MTSASRRVLLAVIATWVLAAPVGSRSAGLESCKMSPSVQPIATTWLPLIEDPNADPGKPGYAELIEFESQPQAQVGKAFLVRLGSLDGRTLFERDRRSWAVVADLSPSHSYAIAYSYLDSAKSADIWVYIPKKRRVQRPPHVPGEGGLSWRSLCGVLRSAGLAEEVRIVARTIGYIPPTIPIRRAIDVRRGGSR